MTKKVDNKRRDFLKISGATAAMMAGQGHLFAKSAVILVENGKENYPNTSYTEKMYRNEFKFTYGKKEEHGFAYHCVNCQGNCAWEVWSHNGVVTRENQSARYPSVNAKIPDFNPRGCNKGVQHSQVMYEKDRILYPMKRVGERGKGSWKRLSWDEAATEVAQKVWDTLTDETKGPSKLLVQAGTGLLTEGRRGAPLRFCTQLGASRIYPASYLGDMFSGAAVAYGEGNVGCTYDFLYQVNTAVFWGANPSVSRIPDAHFVWEGKYNGAKVIVITPEFNASAKSADLWLPIKPGTDNILAMGIINEILNEKLYKPEFLKTYTDLPFLVDIKTKKLLRKSDITGNHEDHSQHEEFYCMNKKTGKIALMPGTEGSKHHTLRLDDFGIEPILEGVWGIEVQGKKREVTTAFEMLKKNAQPFTAEVVAKECFENIAPSVIKQLAKDIALPKVVEITAGFSLNKYFNGLLSVWNIASICGLTGRMGPYGGLNTEGEWNLSGLGELSGFKGKYSPRFGSGFVGEFVMGNGIETVEEYFSDEDIKKAHNGYNSNSGIDKKEYLQIIKEMLKDADMSQGENGKGHVHWDPEVAILIADSRFRRNKGSKYREAFLKKMKYVTVVDYKMSEAAVWADLVLPAKSHYEVWDIRSSPGYHRYTNLAQPAANLKPIGEAMDEWSMFTLIAKKLEEIANKPENIQKAKVKDDKRYARDGYHDLAIFHKEFTNTDEESESQLEPYLGTDKMAVQAALEKCDQYQPHTIEKMYKQGGFLQINEKGGKSSPLYADRPYNTMENHLFKFERLETVSGRQQFYVDAPMFLRLGAYTNTGLKGIRPDNKEYPFTLMTPHARWSIHSNYKTSRTLQRLQRGKPYVAINKKVAEIKGIKDADEIRIYNQLGEFYAMAKVSSSAPMDSMVMEHGWEPYQYKNLKGHNECVPTALNLLEMTHGWGHLNFGGLWDGNQYAYDGAVNVEKV
ncbi:molybdopterin-dependent oxidoreductase [Malaciobacter mytili]|uniref:molybdopterin-dependent oxidoreductase n=1 Tax=Malaciobacter mytili TaxID=603050 RepID=UPI003BAF4D7A